MFIYRDGVAQNVVFGLIVEFKPSSVLFSINKKMMEVFVSEELMEELKEIYQENEHAAIPIHIETKTVMLDGDVPERKLGEELMEANIDEQNI